MRTSGPCLSLLKDIPTSKDCRRIRIGTTTISAINTQMTETKKSSIVHKYSLGSCGSTPGGGARPLEFCCCCCCCGLSTDKLMAPLAAELPVSKPPALVSAVEERVRMLLASEAADVSGEDEAAGSWCAAAAWWGSLTLT